MSSERNTNMTAGGSSLTTLLFITFLVLKLCGVIDWSWWWITAPIWIPVGMALIGLFIYLVLILIYNRD